MSIRIATFNVDNLFSRPKVMNESDWAKSQPIINDNARLNLLLGHETYSDEDKTEIMELLKKYKLHVSRPNNKYLEVRDVRGQLLKHPKGKPAEIKARGRSDWVGWVELKKEAIDAEGIKNTARVIADVNPDIIVMVEVESRPALLRFHDQILQFQMKDKKQDLYPHIMLIDGNDLRGIDVGIMSRLPLLRMVSHVDDKTDAGSPTFSRDCPEYYILLPDGSELAILPNHLASKGSDTDGARRRIQSAAIKEIYLKIRRTHKLVVVAGDLNDHPEGGSLDALLKGTDLKDAMSLPAYTGEFKGTYQRATEKDKIDYLLLSPDMAGKVKAVDVNRRGFYAPQKWKSYENITSETQDTNKASDHHCLWADIDV